MGRDADAHTDHSIVLVGALFILGGIPDLGDIAQIDGFARGRVV